MMKIPSRSTSVKAASALLVAALCPGVAAQDYNAQPAPEELAKLGLEGTELTPAGAIRAGNAEGTIPAWKFEPIQAPAGWQPGTACPADSPLSSYEVDPTAPEATCVPSES